MRCEHCDQGHQEPVFRAKLAEREGRVAVLLRVPMTECSACGERWLEFDVAARIDELFTEMLRGDAGVITCPYDRPPSGG